MSRDWDAVSYVGRSKYRERIAAHLYDHGAAAPSEIADAAGYALPHVSRALAQLRDEGLVELLVSEDQHHGRLYGLTDTGRGAVEHLRRDRLASRMTVSAPEQFTDQELLSFLRDELGGSLRRVERYTDDTAEVTFVRSELCGETIDDHLLLTELALAWRRQVPDEAVRSFGEEEYMVEGFESILALYPFPDEESHYAVSADASVEVSVRSLVEQCFECL